MRAIAMAGFWYRHRRRFALAYAVQNYRRLLVWRKGHALAVNVQRLSRSFPRQGHSALRSQITRASASVPTNIVEGCFAATQKEFARYLDISIKSTGEVEYQLQLARDYGLIANRDCRGLTADTIEVRRMLVGLRQRVQSRPVPAARLLKTDD